MNAPAPVRRSWVPAVILAAVGVVFVLFNQQRAATRQARQEKEALAAQVAELQRGLAEARAAPAPAAAVPEPVPPAEPAAEPGVAAPPAPAAPEPVAEPGPVVRATGLLLEKTSVEVTDAGLTATLRFAPEGAEPVGVVAIVVRVPRDGDARIVDLGPRGAAKFGDVSKRVAEDGKFAIYQGTPEAVEALEFALSVSAPVAADVRGTAGIGPLELTIGPTEATARSY